MEQVKTHDLSTLDALDGATIAMLRGLWIDTVEELLGLTTAIEENVGARVGALPGLTAANWRGAALAMLPPGRREALTTPARSHPLGCRSEPSGPQGTRGSARPVRPRTTPMALASRARLVDGLLPIKDQGSRGTCVAFAATALREFLDTGTEEFSEQFFYWACKQRDGSDGAGTFLSTAGDVMREDGVCLGRTWPYNPVDIQGNESQDPPPTGADTEARQFALNSSVEYLDTSDIEAVKAVLSGADGYPATPVVIGTSVFRSWFRSSETARTGKITMPLPGEEAVGGHAWCLVGYVDAADVPGGGYFIVRNSWGMNWAPDNTEGAGHALMPYAYLAQYGDGFTWRAANNDRAGVVTEPISDRRRYVRVLSQGAVDQEGLPLPAGTRVIGRPDALNEVMRDTDDNWEVFRKRGFAWTSRALAAGALAVPPSQTALGPEIEPARGARRAFEDAIAGNVTALATDTVSFPAKGAPWLHNLVPWHVWISSAKPHATLDRDLALALRKFSAPTLGTDWPDPWQELVRETTSLRVYSIKGLGGRTDIVAAYVAPFVVRANGQASFCPAVAPILDAVKSSYAGWLRQAGRSLPRQVYFTAGSFTGWSDAVTPTASGDSWTLLSRWRKPEAAYLPSWEWFPPKGWEHERLSTRNFVEALKPETSEGRLARVGAFVETQLSSEATTSRSVQRAIGVRESLVQNAFLALQKKGFYVERFGEGLRIRRRRQNDPPELKESVGAEKSWLLKHASKLVTAVAAVAVQMGLRWLIDKNFSFRWQDLLVAAVVTYVQQLVVKHLKRFEVSDD